MLRLAFAVTFWMGLGAGLSHLPVSDIYSSIVDHQVVGDYGQWQQCTDCEFVHQDTADDEITTLCTKCGHATFVEVIGREISSGIWPFKGDVKVQLKGKVLQKAN